MRSLIRAGSAALACLVLSLCWMPGAAAQTQSNSQDVDVQWGVKIPLRDGVKLNATLYRPSPQPVPLPVVFTLTPYTSDTYHERGIYFARNGYVFVLVDVRGRGNSEGKFEPMANEARDGYDVVEWLAAQSWSNGKIAMWGGSYAGFDQWATAKEFPPHLATIVPAAAAHPGVDFPFGSNIFYPYDMQWLTLVSGLTANFHLFGEDSYWRQKFADLYTKHLPFNQLDTVVGNPSWIFQKWMDHPTPDAYWNAMVPSPDDYRKISIPILTITGDYDGDQRGALTYYQRHMQYGSPNAVARHYLIIGPWDHAGTRTPTEEVGGLHFGKASLLDLNALHKAWFDWTMKDGPKPEFLKKRVAYYVLGPGVWKYADDFDSLAKDSLVLYLHASSGARDAFYSGSLSPEKPGAEVADPFTYDPLDIRPAELEENPSSTPLLDQRYALNLYGNGAVYHSEPFAENTEISGYLKLTVWISMDVPDTDLEADVYEILSDGTSIALTDAELRARYRDSLTEAKLVTPGEITHYDLTSFQWFSRRIAKGSRLRLVLHCPNYPSAGKNYNSGGVVVKETAKDARTAHLTVVHDAAHPSALILPVVH